MNKFSHFMAAATLAWASSHAATAEPSTWEQVKSYTHEKKTEVVAEGKKMIAATDKKIDALKADAAKSSGEVKKAHEQNMKELQAKRHAAQLELDKMEKSASHTWSATKEGFHQAYKDLHQAYDKAQAGPAKR